VARRDKAFADQLIVDGSAHMTKDDRQLIYSQLARIALDEGDREAASQSIEESMQIDPTQIAFVDLVNELALKDRAAADKLIIQCMADLSIVQLSNRDFSAGRADLMLRWLVFPNSFANNLSTLPGPIARTIRPVLRDKSARPGITVCSGSIFSI
jgi:hypothetical protein